jgi:hypothetical protein
MEIPTCGAQMSERKIMLRELEMVVGTWKRIQEYSSARGSTVASDQVGMFLRHAVLIWSKFNAPSRSLFTRLMHHACSTFFNNF